MRSVVVVLPASMWAMIPMLRVLPSGNSRIAGPPLLPDFPTAVLLIASLYRSWSWPPYRPRSPAVMGERPVGVRHLVRVFLQLHRGAGAVGGVQQLGRQPVGHGLL